MRDWLNAALRRLPVWPFYWLGALPAAWYFWNGLQGRLGADPVKALEHEYGLIALQFLIAALCVTPLREIAGINLLRFRRMLGLMAFSYACLHLAVWLGLDRQFDWPRIVADLTKRPYIILGMAAFLMLVPLAWTSRDAALRRMGPVAWRRLHRLAYPATALAAIHFVWLVKAWPLEPLLYAAGVAALLGWRALRGRRRRARRPALG
ncbi:MAG TPA: protein-methionine-sulfoxide reductase heme-binding subunit MsrQ [Amaricoccus sp.]|uniref:protein-methionine-sulfoxide reductase heme-binding subunit MsrQ n=1 Tax=Amaricoccus sp. TaxID=1872485 RepID=UPI002B84EE1D|nr:protein-methionine-sulfoxide reductase heme-binding subunit MsrQ [Amaricoccus sp.]HMQ94224.1 protein-methionine-sulfoxide reductase heme-binding subunit MsrQ [Amaricoccus sp.]HMR52319.1 protein-methionine-sulfoxide reductase heme-binding subunit MsrQ [Amaricoccus sp.]HMR62046.1 protein-methionine-sulfoxide reductase heme-binding subunit MsrQ [Amaricoccus sp.]HMT99240.1 protein-methionine-sulfoxide reductase heme-binding subunit MsrQ [Amaricoccus sp.]